MIDDINNMNDARYLNCATPKFDAAFYGTNVIYGNWMRLKMKNVIERNNDYQELVDNETLEWMNGLIDGFDEVLGGQSTDDEEKDSN